MLQNECVGAHAVIEGDHSNNYEIFSLVTMDIQPGNRRSGARQQEMNPVECGYMNVIS